MRKTVRIVSLMLVFVMTVMSCLVLSSCSDRQVPDGMKSANIDGDLFRLYVPKSWTTTTESGFSGAVYSGNENTTVNVTSYPSADGEDVDRFTASLRDHFKVNLKDYSELAELKSFKLSGQDARKYRFSAKFGDVPYSVLEVISKYENDFYIITFTTPEEKYDSRVDVFEKMIDVFTFESEPYSSDAKDKKIPKKVSAPDKMKLVSDNRMPYRFFAPEEWQNDTSAKDFTSVYFSDTDGTNISVITYLPRETDKMTPKEFFDMQKAGLENNGFVFKGDVKTSQKEADGYTFTLYEFTVEVGGKEYFYIEAVIGGAMVYCVTYTSLPENAELHRADYYKTLESFYVRKFSELFNSKR